MKNFKKILSMIFTFIFLTGIIIFDTNTIFAADAKSIINSAKLGAPMKTGYTDIDNKIAELIAEGKSKTSDRYGLVKWLYEKCIYKNSYGYAYGADSHMNNKTYGVVTPFPDWLVDEASGPLFYNKGVCNSYAAEFMLITRALGFESYYFSGETRRAQNAGFTGHAWCEIKINGVNYIFDTQVEDNVADSQGKIIYLYFCKTEAEMKDRYVWNWESINKNMQSIGSEANLKSLEEYLIENNCKSIRVSDFNGLKSAVSNIMENGINKTNYFIILNGEMDKKQVSDYLQNTVVSKTYRGFNMPDNIRKQYMTGNAESVKAEYDYEMYEPKYGVDTIGIVCEFTPQENLYLYGEGSLADNIHIPDISKIKSEDDAVNAVLKFSEDLSSKQKKDGDVLDISALFAEESAAKANSIEIEGYSVDVDDKMIDDAVKCSVGSLNKVFDDEKMSLMRNNNTNITVNMPDDKKLSFSHSGSKKKAQKIRYSTAYASLIVDNDKNFSAAMEKKDGNKVFVDFKNKLDSTVVKITFPGINVNSKNAAVVDENGNVIGGKYNPVTKELEAKISNSGTFSVIDNAKSFSDIKNKSGEVRDAIELLASKGIINGTSETEFSPDSPITRAEVTALVCRIISKYDPNADGGFDDVTKADWYFGAAGSGKNEGIINGYVNNTFRGKYIIPKIQIVSIAARVLKTEMGYKDVVNTYSVLSEFSDAYDIADWGKNDVALAANTNMVVRRKDNTFVPNDEMTRGDAAVVLKRLFDKVW